MSTGDAIRMPAPIEGIITEVEPAKDGRPPLLMLTVPEREIDPEKRRLIEELGRLGRSPRRPALIEAGLRRGGAAAFDEAERIARGRGR